MSCVAGVDGAPDGWAVVIKDGNQWFVENVTPFCEIFEIGIDFDLIAIDVPIGLLDVYEIGGRACDRAARRLLGKSRGSSVFPAPVRPVLSAASYEEACVRSRESAPHGRAISKQCFCILPKIREIDEVLQTRPELRELIREVHPEVCFAELAGNPMSNRKASSLGRMERKEALARPFPELSAIEKVGRHQGLPIEDILDAAVACWSALRLAQGAGRSVGELVHLDATGLRMAIGSKDNL